VMVLLDSNHTHEHVLRELRFYGPLVTKGQYLIVSDTIVEDIPTQEHRPRQWGPGDNPKTALRAYLQETDRFEVDAYASTKTLLTCSPDGYCRCIKD
jgi:cephalosporin hydroxylase